MEKVGLSFVIGAVVGASFKTSINGVKTSIGDINREVKQLSSRRNELLDKKWIKEFISVNPWFWKFKDEFSNKSKWNE